MQPEHAHLDMNYGIHAQPKVSHEAHVKEVAHAALKHIPGGSALVTKTFNKGAWKKPFALPQKRHINQALHLGWGDVHPQKNNPGDINIENPYY